MATITAVQLHELEAFRMNGHTPFGGSAQDNVYPLLEEAQALLIALANAFEDADAVSEKRHGDASEFGALRPLIKGAGLRGISSLIALAAYFSEQAGEQALQASRAADAA